MISKRKDSSGFTLIEVLVASFIMMIAVAGFVTLQSKYMRTDLELNLRLIALQLAQEKVDDLKNFEVLEVTAGEVAFNDIDDNTGGSLGAGNVVVNVKSDNSRNYTFSRSWNVTKQYYVDTNADGIPETWVNEGTPSAPSPEPPVADQKLVSVSIAWTDVEGQVKNVSLESIIPPVLASRSFQANNETDNAKVQPKVAYTPGLAPDVISYDLGNGENIETSKPVPDIDNQGENNVVQFETIRFINLPGQTDKLEQEDFLTVNCNCKLGGSGLAKTPSMTVYNGNELVVKPGVEVSKTVGVLDGSQQPDICTACCRDHHDTSKMVNDEQFFRTEGGLPHGHYKRLANGLYSKALSTGDAYEEICRFKRVDGYFQIYPDWQLIDVIEFSDRYLLDSDKLTSYTNYTESKIAAEIRGTSPPDKPSDRDITVAPGGYQLIARGIYLDRMTASHKSALKTMIASGSSDWKAFTPFYDVNLTLLSQWESLDTDIATVTNEDIRTIIDPINDFYGTYSRGRVEALFDGDVNILTKSMAYNASITGTSPVSPAEELGALIDSSLRVTVDSKSAAEKFFAIIGNINCLITINGITEACDTNNDKKATYVDLSDVDISVDPAQFVCPITIPKGKSTPFFSCENVSENWRGDIAFAFTKLGYTATIKIKLPDGSTIESDRITLDTGLDSTSNQEYEVIIELSKP
ncbi:type IV pilus modification PilV family protein [Alteromonas hispanica]|uniref:Prepilin-type N-terminal cleavage/methylation domain-containing protein n=1 Tax=Alteromonas hispanica TaxID=315421 RepID=A0A6L9MY69_9ALTE|nr:prepilin-type N-terminal cleavage/methylation domain-containing protein [Alteromonas hispanica]NDW22893.1 hypothetical protein [Alteromonas hispanica]